MPVREATRNEMWRYSGPNERQDRDGTVFGNDCTFGGVDVAATALKPFSDQLAGRSQRRSTTRGGEMRHIDTHTALIAALAAALALAVMAAPAGAATTGSCSISATATVGLGADLTLVPELTPHCLTNAVFCPFSTGCLVVGNIRGFAQAGLIEPRVKVVNRSGDGSTCGPALNSCEATTGGWYARWGEPTRALCSLDGIAAVMAGAGCTLTMTPWS
jgi:hypothetical protein